MGWRSDIIDGIHVYEALAEAVGPTALDVTKTISLVAAGTDDTQDLYTLANAQLNQRKLVSLLSGTDTLRITPANLKDFTYIVLTTPGDYVVLEFTGVHWELTYLGRGASAI